MKSRPYPVKYLPAAQSWQVPEVDAPTTAEYEPGPQSAQVLLACIPVPVE